jgi:hypothetical protein
MSQYHSKSEQLATWDRDGFILQPMTSYRLLKLVLVIAAWMFLPSIQIYAETVLPIGIKSEPLEFPHFPDRLHALVWRNWQVVEPGRIAKVVGATEEQIRGIATTMGLPAHPNVSSQWRRSGYITIIRRNWHLVPYEQLLLLVDMPADELALALREDDFLFEKLGDSKPQCLPIQWTEPNENARARAQEIKQIVSTHFGNQLSEPPHEPPFDFKRQLSEPVGDATAAHAATLNRDGLRFIFSYFGAYGDPLTDAELNPYPDGLLSRLAENGINGIWLHVVLRQLAPGGGHFPEFGSGHEQRIKNLRILVARAKRFGISVYLYQNEPRAMPKDFFADRTEMGGVVEGEYRALCTSNPLVQQWLEDSLAFVFREVPDLGGIFTITASENLTNCASQGRSQDCPYCSKRDPDEIIAEVNTIMARGVRRSSPRAKVIAWDWGWHNHGEATGVIAKLPTDAWLMSVSEWALPIERGGVQSKVGEYALSVIGPGPRAKNHWTFAKRKGLKTIAKVQFNNSWELSAVPYLPAMDLVAGHAANLAREKIDGMMLSWSLGGYPSPNLRLAQRLVASPDVKVEQALDDLAVELYGPEAAPQMRQAWTAFSKALGEYPLHIATLYKGPQHWGPANLLFAKPTDRTATTIGFPYDDLNLWRGIYPADVFASQFEKVAEYWRKGVAIFQDTIEVIPNDQREFAKQELQIVEAAQIHFASVGNQSRFILTRNALLGENVNDDERERLQKITITLLDQEMELAKRLFHLARRDSRIGFEASNHYYYTPLDLVEKVVNCEQIRQSLLDSAHQ